MSGDKRDMESAAEDGPSGETNANDLIKGLMGSHEAIASLAEALIPSLLLGLKLGEQPGQRVTPSPDMWSCEKNPYNSAVGRVDHITAGSAASSQNSNAAVSETSNTAGSGTSTTAGHSLLTTRHSSAAGTQPTGHSNAAGPSGSAMEYYPPFPSTSWAPPMAPYFLPPPPWVNQPSNTENPGPPSSLEAPTPLVSTLSDEEEDDVNLWLSEDERGQLLSGLESGPDEETEDEPPQPKKAKFMPQPRTVKILRAVTEQPVSNDKRRMITNKYPLPSCDQAHTPKLNLDISCIVPKSAISHDRFLSKLQHFSMDALGPLAWIHERLSAEEAADPVQTKEAAKAAIALLGLLQFI